MNPTRFAAGHAAHADWHVALARALDALLLELRAAGGHDHTGRDGLPEYTLGFCYLSDPFAADADEIVADRSSIVGSIGVVSATFGLDKAIARQPDNPTLLDSKGMILLKNDR